MCQNVNKHLKPIYQQPRAKKMDIFFQSCFVLLKGDVKCEVEEWEKEANIRTLPPNVGDLTALQELLFIQFTTQNSQCPVAYLIVSISSLHITLHHFVVYNPTALFIHYLGVYIC